MQNVQTNRSIARFDISKGAKLEAQFSLYTTLFIIFVLLVGVYFFSRDSKSLSLQITEPLRSLCDDMEKASHLEVDELSKGYEQTINSNVYEIRHCQAAFLKIRHGINSFAKYVPKEVVQKLMLVGEEAMLGVRPKPVSILFSDIAGFTTISEAMDPPDLLILLSDYFEKMSELILQRGTLLEFIGDAILGKYPILVCGP